MAVLSISRPIAWRCFSSKQRKGAMGDGWLGISRMIKGSQLHHLFTYLAILSKGTKALRETVATGVISQK